MELRTENVEQENQTHNGTIYYYINKSSSLQNSQIYSTEIEEKKKTELIPIQCDQFISYMNSVTKFIRTG